MTTAESLNPNSVIRQTNSFLSQVLFPYYIFIQDSETCEIQNLFFWTNTDEENEKAYFWF